MQVAKKALMRDPGTITWSANHVEHLLRTIQQLTDPPLDLNAVLRRGRPLRSTPACHVQTVLWLRNNLQLSEKDVRRCLSNSPCILERSSVNISITEHAPFTLSRPVCCGGCFGIAFQHLGFGFNFSQSYPALGLKPCVLDMAAGGHGQDDGGTH